MATRAEDHIEHIGEHVGDYQRPRYFCAVVQRNCRTRAHLAWIPSSCASALILPQLCLLQISVGERTVCIDTLALADLSPLRPRWPRGRSGKVLHAVRQDLGGALARGWTSRGLFDTQVAAALIGLPAHIGYGDLVKQMLAVSLHKAETRADWSRRPLSSAQIAYALDDVRYLLPLRERLFRTAAPPRPLALFEEEMAPLDAAGSFAIDPEQAWRRIRGLADLDPVRQQLGCALAAWRERRGHPR